jgi:hypothetical protein
VSSQLSTNPQRAVETDDDTANTFDSFDRNMSSRSLDSKEESTNLCLLPFGITVATAVAKRRTLMLRIYIHDDVPVTSFVLEGKLIGPWVKELEKYWQSAVATNPSRMMLVDLADVTFVDQPGRDLLKEMRHQGVRLLSHGVLIDAIVAGIEADQTTRERIASGR